MFKLVCFIVLSLNSWILFSVLSILLLALYTEFLISVILQFQIFILFFFLLSIFCYEFLFLHLFQAYWQLLIKEILRSMFNIEWLGVTEDFFIIFWAFKVLYYEILDLIKSCVLESLLWHLSDRWRKMALLSHPGKIKDLGLHWHLKAEGFLLTAT